MEGKACKRRRVEGSGAVEGGPRRYRERAAAADPRRVERRTTGDRAGRGWRLRAVRPSSVTPLTPWENKGGSVHVPPASVSTAQYARAGQRRGARAPLVGRVPCLASAAAADATGAGGGSAGRLGGPRPTATARGVGAGRVGGAGGVRGRDGTPPPSDSRPLTRTAAPTPRRCVTRGGLSAGGSALQKWCPRHSAGRPAGRAVATLQGSRKTRVRRASPEWPVGAAPLPIATVSGRHTFIGCSPASHGPYSPSPLQTRTLPDVYTTSQASRLYSLSVLTRSARRLARQQSGLGCAHGSSRGGV